MQTLLEMAKELVYAQIAVNKLKADDVSNLMQETHDTLQKLEKIEMGIGTGFHSNSDSDSHFQIPDWRKSITKKTVRCMECDIHFRQLSARHLQQHGLNPRSYRKKYNMPSRQALSSRDVTKRRREVVQQIRPWELAIKKREDAKLEAEAKVAASKKTTKAKKAKAPSKKVEVMDDVAV